MTGKKSDNDDNLSPASSRYEGELLDGHMHGKGKLLFSDGKIYDGEFHEGEIHGKGKLTYPNGDFIEGDFIESVPSETCRWQADRPGQGDTT